MDWQTKEYIDEKFSDIEDDLKLIKEKLGIDENKSEDFFNYDETKDEELDEEPIKPPLDKL